MDGYGALTQEGFGRRYPLCESRRCSSGPSSQGATFLKSRLQRLAHAHFNPHRHGVQFARSMASYRDLEAQYRAAEGDEHLALRTELRAIMREERAILQGLEAKRERALQKILLSFDPAESERLFEEPLFCDALYVKADPEALIDALLSIQSNRSGGSDSLHEEAADLVKFTEVSSGCGLHEFYARISTRIRALLLDPGRLRSLDSEDRVLLTHANARVEQFVCYMLSSPETIAALRALASVLPDPAQLEKMPLEMVATRVLSQRSLAQPAPKGATVSTRHR